VTITPQIDALIDKSDNVEMIRDKIAEILLVESDNQQALANVDGKDFRLWKLRVFTGRSRPWEEFSDDPDQVDATPIVNVSFSRGSADLSASNTVERQKFSGTYHIDCYGYGVTQSVPGAGHYDGDAKSETEAHRALRLVRNILMSSFYTYLGMRGVVWRRMTDSVEIFDLPIDSRNARNVRGARLTLGVDFNELSPQVQGQLIDTVHVDVLRAENGELYFDAEYGDS